MLERTKPDKAVALCCGCRDNFYNGNNPYGVQRCWSFESAKLVPRIRVGVWQRPPYDLEAWQWCMSCHKPDGAVQVNPDALTLQGFWKG